MYRINYETEKLEKNEDDFSMFNELVRFIAVMVVTCAGISLTLFYIL